MVRWFLLACLLLWLGSGLQNGWIVVNWDKMITDLNLPIDKFQPKEYLK
jgi:hypothetical protein